MEASIPIHMPVQENIINKTVKKYGQPLLAFVKKRVKRLQDAEDILQEVWVQLSLLTNISEIVHIDKWLYRVSQNKITDLYRKQSTTREAALEDDLFAGDDSGAFIRAALFADTAAQPEMELLKKTFWQAFSAALEALPEKQRAVFIQNELEQKTLQQIANEQGENIKTIISRKGYAVKHLRASLQQVYDDIMYKN